MSWCRIFWEYQYIWRWLKISSGGSKTLSRCGTITFQFFSWCFTKHPTCVGTIETYQFFVKVINENTMLWHPRCDTHTQLFFFETVKYTGNGKPCIFVHSVIAFSLTDNCLWYPHPTFFKEVLGAVANGPKLNISWQNACVTKGSRLDPLF